MFRFVVIYAIKSAVFFLFLMILCFHVNAQVISPNPTVPSANIAGEKQSIEVSNDLYNGRLNISLPVYDYKFEGIIFPITLNYTGGNGIKPDELPGWVGSGWYLEAGGYVHRTVRGRPDEVRDFETSIWTDPSQLNPKDPSKTTKLNNNYYNYFNNYSVLNADPNWYTEAYASNFKPSTDGDPRQDGDNTIYNSNPVIDLVPDEFTFSCGGISGKFYLNHENKWVVAANDGKTYSVEMNTGEHTLVDFEVKQTGGRAFYQVPKIIKNIILTSTDGIKYTFGDFWVNDPTEKQRFDYSHTSSVMPVNSNNARPPQPGVSGHEAATLIEVVPHTWHITSIENIKTGSVITFEYKQQGFTFYKTKFAWGRASETGATIIYANLNYVYDDPDNSDDYHNLSAVSKVLNRGWTLTAINFPNGVKLDFNSSLSSQLSTNENIMTSDNSGFYSNEDIFYYPGISGQANNLFKLDNIKVSFEGQVKKEIDFNYVLSSSQRLQLDRVVNKANTQGPANEYKFTYNNAVALPAYGKGKNDHWGYFNDQDFFTSIPAPYNTGILSTYTNYREPNTEKGKAEILTNIKYPDGGSVVFTYEAQKYSQTRTLDNVSDPQPHKVAGGVRIAKMSYYSAANQLEYEKQYEYTIPGTNFSSGVLGVPIPRYLVQGTSNYSFQAAGYNPTSYEGNNVTYTFAAERQAGNGKTLYEYTNYDNNGFNDAPPIATNAPEWVRFTYAYKHNAFKRGKLKSLKVFLENGQPVKETVLHYTHENSEADKDEVRSLYIASSHILYYASVSERIYPDRVISQEEKTFSGSSTVSKKTFTTYDTYGNIKEVLSYDSKGERNRQIFKYCHEYAGVNGPDDMSSAISLMSALGIRSSGVESLTIHEQADGSNPVITGGELYIYKKQDLFVFKKYRLNVADPIPYTPSFWSTISNTWFVMSDRYTQADATYDYYDDKGNVLLITPKSGLKESYVWGYNKSLPVAKVLNAEYILVPGTVSSFRKEFYYEGFEEWTLTGVIIPYAGIGCYYGDYQVQYVPPNAKNYVVDYRYYDGTRWRFAKKPYTYLMVLTEGVAIDEVRVYPENAQMTTYTHSPLVGVTSETDQNGKTVFYGYDEHNRLNAIYDEDKNIINAWCYNQAGQRENCFAPYGNDYLEQEFTRTNCGPDNIAGTMKYVIKSGVYVSLKSKEEANQQALLDLNNNGQNYVNQHGSCTQIVYARLDQIDRSGVIVELEPNEGRITEVRGDLIIRFFSDQACTQPASVSGLVIHVELDPDTWKYIGNGPPYVEFEADGTEAEVITDIPLRRVQDWWDPQIMGWQTLATTYLHPTIQPSPYIHIK